MLSRFVIAAFRPKPGKSRKLAALVAKHWELLKAESLVTNRPRYAMKAGDGTMIEVFEWSSADAIERAHATPSIRALWAEFEEVCDYVPLSSLPESQHPFSEFEPLPI